MVSTRLGPVSGSDKMITLSINITVSLCNSSKMFYFEMSGLKQTTFFFFQHNLFSLSNPMEYLDAVNLYFMLKLYIVHDSCTLLGGSSNCRNGTMENISGFEALTFSDCRIP